MRSGKRDKKRQDKGSISIIWTLIPIAVTGTIILSNKTETVISSHSIVHYIGLGVILMGMVFRFISIFSLGRFFTVDVTIRENHELKKDGIYKIIRHPSYSGSLLSFVGFGISLNNWLSLIAITSLVTIAFLYRIRIEERLLAEQFGSDYLDRMFEKA
ncbi:MAG: isoprenylcysteine carboxylmethyltransferase family protein [Bacteroidota bacterium]